MARPADSDRGPGPAVLTRLIRDEWPRVLATLVRTTGSLQLAEDALQDAAVRALGAWSRDGPPPEPRAWLTLTARRRALDLLRREARRPDKERAARRQSDVSESLGSEDQVMRDDMLRLLFTCCHPALPMEAQTALALRTLCGLTTAEVASALLVSEATMAKRLVRAKQKISAAAIPYRTPDVEELPRRLQGVLSTIYLLFNEGYHATVGEGALRLSLTAEAIRLATLVRELFPDQVSVVGLEALLRLHNARSPARLDHQGEIVRLPDQDRSQWDRTEIHTGLKLLGLALRHSTEQADAYVVQAAIAACHDLAETWEATNWAAIVSWYDVLMAVADSPVVRLNRAVAMGELQSPEAALVELERIRGLEAYLPYVASRAALLQRVGRVEEARLGFCHAMDLAGNKAVRHELSRQLASLSD